MGYGGGGRLTRPTENGKKTPKKHLRREADFLSILVKTSGKSTTRHVPWDSVSLCSCGFLLSVGLLVGRRKQNSNYYSTKIALLMPRMTMPMKPKKIHRLRLWFKLKLSTNSCRATLTIMPAVMAKMQA